MRTPNTLSSSFLSAVLFLSVFLSGGGLRVQEIFSDDFNRSTLGSFWDGNGGWTIRSGQAYNDPDRNWTPLTTVRSFDAPTYVLETSAANLVDGYQRAYYFLFAQEEGEEGPGYSVIYNPGSKAGGVLSLGKTTDNYLYPAVLDKQIVTIDADLSFRLRVVKYENGLIQVYLGGADGFPDLPTLEAIDTTYRTLGQVSWTNFTQSVGEDFFVDYVRATVPETQKTEPERPADDELVKQIVTTSDNSYALGRLRVGETFFTDRPYTITDLPAFLEGARVIKTPNDDKRLTDPNLLQLYLAEEAIAYLAYDPRGSQLPTWLDDWTKTDEVIGTTDPGSDYYEVYTRIVPRAVFAAYPFVLRVGGNLAAPAAGSEMNYIVALAPTPPVARYEAEDATLSGVTVATNHEGYSGTGFADYLNPTRDYVEWTVDVPLTSPYDLSVQYANGSNTARELALTIDGAAAGTVSFSPTGAFQTPNVGLWNRWRGRLLGDAVLLSAGTHRIRLTAVGSSGPNVDYLQLRPTDNYTPPGSMLAGSVPFSAGMAVAGATSASLDVFPNPTADVVTFRSNRWEEGAHLRILDLRGRQFYGQPLPAGQQRIDVSAWPAGVYLYQLVNGQEEILSGQFVRE